MKNDFIKVSKDDRLSHLDYNVKSKILIVRLTSGLSFIFFNVEEEEFQRVNQMKTKTEVFSYLVKNPSHLHLE